MWDKFKEAIRKQPDYDCDSIKSMPMQQHDQLHEVEERLKQMLAMAPTPPGNLTAGQLGSALRGNAAGGMTGYQQWAQPKKEHEVELCGIKFTERELTVMKKLLEAIARQKQMETLPADIDQAVKEAVQMLG